MRCHEYFDINQKILPPVILKRTARKTFLTRDHRKTFVKFFMYKHNIFETEKIRSYEVKQAKYNRDDFFSNKNVVLLSLNIRV